MKMSIHRIVFVYLLPVILFTTTVHKSKTKRFNCDICPKYTYVEDKNLIILHSMDAILCYQCTSVNDTRCIDLKHDNTSLDLYRECTGNYQGKEPFCRKTVQTIIDEVKIVRVHRSCGWEEDNNAKPCYNYENDFHLEVVCVCLTDGCNVAPPSLTPMALLITVAIAGTMMFRR